MVKFDVEKVMLLNRLAVETSGGLIGIRDYDLLDSAVNSIYQTFFGEELYQSKEEKGARLGFNLVSAHAFLDGNKRTGLIAMLSFFAINGIKLEYTDKELIDVGFALAEGKIKYEGLLLWVNNHKVSTKEK